MASNILTYNLYEPAVLHFRCLFTLDCRILVFIGAHTKHLYEPCFFTDKYSTHTVFSYTYVFYIKLLIDIHLLYVASCRHAEIWVCKVIVILQHVCNYICEWIHGYICMGEIYRILILPMYLCLISVLP